MRSFLLTIVFGIFYAASASRDFVSFVNDDQTFTCHGKNIRWVLPIGAQVPENSTKFEIVSYEGQGSQLTVKNINPIDAGDYRCIAENKTDIFALKIYYPLSVDAHPSVVAIRQHQDLSLKCRSNGVPQAQIKWYHGEDELSPNSRYKMVGNELTVKQVQPEHAGVYTCLAIQKLDSFKNVQEREVKVVVEHGPTAGNKGPVISYHNIGSSTTLQCHAKSVPNSQFKWVRNGYEVFDGVTNFNDDSRLTIVIESANSFGNYTCDAMNKHGELHQIFTLRDKADEPHPIISGSTLEKISTSLAFFTLTSTLTHLFV